MSPVLAPLTASLMAPLLALLPVAYPPIAYPAVGPDAVDVGADQSDPTLTGILPPAAPTAAGQPDAEFARDRTPEASGERTMPAFAELARTARDTDRAQQVRIEQRVIIRIAPGRTSRGFGPADVDRRRGLFSPDFGGRGGPRTVERRMNQCVPVGAIAGVQPDGPSRLILFMRDQRIVSAALDKGCNARDYYSGFLVERSSDGMLCASRDKLLSRSGANCGVNKLRQLIEVDDDE